MIAGVGGVAAYAQTGAKIIERDRTSPSIHEGASGERSAGVKTNINPLVGQVPASYSPFRSIAGAIGSLVQPFSVPAPIPGDASTIGFKYAFSQMFFPLFSRTGNINRLFAGQKGIGGHDATDVAAPGIAGDKGPGGLYWVGYSRVGNVENPPPYQLDHQQLDCFCRWDELIRCPLHESPHWNVAFGAPEFGDHLLPSTCQECFGVERIVKHDFYVGESKVGVFDGYPYSYPQDTGYQECLRESTESYAASGRGGSPTNDFYGL